MRLINTQTLHLDEFFGSNIPPYAILSHTWGQEISFQQWMEWQAGKDLPLGRTDAFTKIHGACGQARRDKLEWLWVDTNCIDKTSSSELTEAINSMYKYYRDAVRCYAFLADVPPLSESDQDRYLHFRTSRWFTRGWTLQELLAPKRLDFFTNTWVRIGSKSGSLMRVIHERTGIELSYLSGHTDIAMASVAKKMSWLSKRETTRLEDIAYCMLGIFGINMPLLYGEGMQAFTRLQNEIIRHIYDHTIFCWRWSESVPSDWVSMLAPSPAAFQETGDYVQRTRYESLTHYSTTNLGLLMTLPVLYTFGSRVFLVLDAGLPQNEASTRACIPLRRPAIGSMVFERVHFPRNPVNVPLALPHRQTRYSLYALSQPSPSTLKPAPTRTPSKIALVLFVDPTATQFFDAVQSFGSDLQAKRPFQAKECQISTRPFGMFDVSRYMFFVSPSTHTETLPHTLSVQISPSSDGVSTSDDSYFLFFATDSSKERWHCHITNTKRLKRDKGWISSVPHDLDNVDGHFQQKFARIWKSGAYSSNYRFSDQLNLSVGRRLDVQPGVDTCWCVLSGSSKGHFDMDGSEDEGQADDSDNDSIRAQARRN